MLWRAPNRQFAGLGVCLRSSLLWGDVREMIIHHTDVREIIYSSYPAVGTRPPLLFGIHRGEKGSSLRMRTFAFGKMEIFKGQTPLFRKSATTPGLFVRKKRSHKSTPISYHHRTTPLVLRNRAEWGAARCVEQRGFTSCFTVHTVDRGIRPRWRQDLCHRSALTSA
jgi:hypothetical protein